jgi:glycosyltransferase involved in cell wall biosynthesis
MNWLLREESKRLTTYENLIFDYFENHTIISQQDRDLIYHEKRQHIAIVPNGVDSDFFQTKNADKNYDVVFTGNMNYPPNVSGAITLVRDVKPFVEKSLGKIRVLIAGSSPAPEVKALSEIGGVTVTGWMDDIRDAYDQSKIFVAPMLIGSGMQNKILEAMSMQLPCVTTSLAGNAFTKEQKQHLFISDQLETIAQDIILLLQDQGKRDDVGQKSREVVLEHFNWGATVDLLELTMQKA